MTCPLWLTAGLILATLCHGSPVSDDFEVLTLRKIARDKDMPDHTLFCADGLPEADVYALSTADKDENNEESFQTYDEIEDCVEFRVDMYIWSDRPEEFFAVHGEVNHSVIVRATELIKPFPKLPLQDQTGILAHDRLFPGMYILRMSGGFVLDGIGEDLLVKGDNVSYYVKIDDTNGHYNVCVMANSPNRVLICDGSHLDIEKAMDSEGPTITSATLIIQEDESKASVELKHDGAQPRYEYIITNDAMSHKDVCVAGEECAYERDFVEGVPNVNVRISGLDSKEMIQQTNKIVLHDRDLTLSMISDDVLEGAWKMYRARDTRKYNVILDADESTMEQPDCTNSQKSHCFAYFRAEKISLEPHTCTLQPTKDGEVIATDQIQRKYTPEEEQSLSNELEVQLVHAWKENSREFDVKICFNHMEPKTQASFSHYEALLIGRNGQWLKHQALTESSESSLCFEALTIDPVAFDVTGGVKVIVIQRGIDGFTVLAKGENNLF